MRRKSLYERLLRLEVCSHQEESPPSSLFLQIMAVILDIPPAEVWQMAQKEGRKEGISPNEWLDNRYRLRFFGPRRLKETDNDSE